MATVMIMTRVVMTVISSSTGRHNINIHGTAIAMIVFVIIP